MSNDRDTQTAHRCWLHRDKPCLSECTRPFSQGCARDIADGLALPPITLRQFLLGLSTHRAPEDAALSANTLRLMIADFRAHARRLHAELQGGIANAE